MFPSGKCPNIEISQQQIGGRSWHGVSYVCPHCATMLGVGIDPVALKRDTVTEVVKELKKGRT